MALKDLLYRCPFCGRDPTTGRKDHAHCAGCGRHYRRGPAPALIEVTGSGGSEPVPARELVERLAAWGPPSLPDGAHRGGGVGEGGGASPGAWTRVRVRRATEEEPIRLRKRLLGFVERLGPAVEMRLYLGRKAVELHGGSGARHRWNLMDLRAVQASSSSLQVYTRSEELVHFRFLEDSAFRWEALLQEALRSAYRAAGKGEILEFQPRIVVR